MIPLAFALGEDDPISAEQLAIVFPGAERATGFEGVPPAATVLKEGKVVGYLLSTLATVGSTGYSGKPLDVLVGVSVDGVITGASLRRHSEPILVIGVSEEQLRGYVGGFAGMPITAAAIKAASTAANGFRPPDAIAGATVSSAVIGDAIRRAAQAVAASRGLLDGANADAGARLDRETYAAATWDELIKDGSIARRRVTFDEVISGGSPQKTFLDLYVAPLVPPRIGENVLGKIAYGRLIAHLPPGDQALLIAGDGFYSIKGTGFTRTGRFERLRLVQDDRTIPLTTDGYENIEKLKAEGAPEPREAGVFLVREAERFDPLRPWRLDVLVAADEVHGFPGQVLSLPYDLPERYRRRPEPAPSGVGGAGNDEQPLWLRAWQGQVGRIAGVFLLLGVLTAILVFQSAVVERPLLWRRLRWAFLAVTLFWLGWWVGGQLSVVNVLTFSHSLMTDFKWDFFLLEPVIFLLWSYVAIVLLFWGRGVFCGWLCPFGALQEFVSGIGKRLKIKPIEVPFSLHERLWPLKYILFVGLFAISFKSMTIAFLGAEVEPFKTAISLHFLRPWPFVLYALSLLVAGLFIERFFCRYLCPLGAALAIPARIRMFEWLKRHPQCGRECQICFHSCPVQAIHPEGQINPNECIHCLKCQRIYADEFLCPPLVARRKRRERREALSSGALGVGGERAG